MNRKELEQKLFEAKSRKLPKGSSEGATTLFYLQQSSDIIDLEQQLQRQDYLEKVGAEIEKQRFNERHA